MRPPFVLVDSAGDIEVFDAVQDLEQYVEPTDVQQNEYVAYDSEGRLLNLRCKEVVSGRLPRIRVPVVQVVGAEQEPAHRDDLRRSLLRFLSQLGDDETVCEQLSLSDLLSRVYRAVRGHRTNGFCAE
jgi:hypothetical protein